MSIIDGTHGEGGRHIQAPALKSCHTITNDIIKKFIEINIFPREVSDTLWEIEIKEK